MQKNNKSTKCIYDYLENNLLKTNKYTNAYAK